MTRQKKTFIHNGLRMVYYEMGAGKPLLFLHGGALHALTYQRNLALLAKNYHVFAPDIPAFGLSDTPKDIWTFLNYAEFFVAFMQKTGLQDVRVVGHSFGGGIAIYLSAMTTLVTKLVLIDASGMSGGRTFLSVFFLYFAKDLKDIFSPKNLSTLFILARDFVSTFFKKFFAIPQITKIFQESLQGSFSGKLTIPTLILWGSGDIVHPVKDAYAFHTLIPTSKVIIIDGGHDWLFFQPQKLTSYIKEFDRGNFKQEDR